MSSKDLAIALKISIDAVRKALSKLYKYDEVEKINLNKGKVVEEGKKYSGRHYVWRAKD